MNERRCRALVVDDSPAMRVAMCDALAALGVAAREAEDGAEAWRALSESRFDLIVTDLHMPVVDGLKLIGLVRAGGAHQRTGIILVTADGSATEQRRALELGANAVLTKPVARELLEDAVRRALRQR